MKPPSNVKTPAQYIASLPADRAKAIATVRALVNKHIPRGYDECLVWGHDRLDDPPVSISRYLQQAADLLRRDLVAEELLLALPDGRVLECESARAAEGGVCGGGEEARHGEVLRSFRVAGRFAARSDWPADLGDFKREVDRDVRTIALKDQGGAGAEGEASRNISEKDGRQARRHQAPALDF